MKALKDQGDRNGCPGLELVDHNRIKELAPYIEGEFALYSPMTGILNTFIYTIALAENAHQNGVEYFFDHEVTGIVRTNQRGTGINCPDPLYEIQTKLGNSPLQNELYRTRWVINSAGLHADVIARMLGNTDYTIYPLSLIHI